MLRYYCVAYASSSKVIKSVVFRYILKWRSGNNTGLYIWYPKGLSCNTAAVVLL